MRKKMAFYLFACLLCFYATVQAADKAAVNVPEEHYKFASIVEGTEIVHDFIVKNKGKADLNINKVKTG